MTDPETLATLRAAVETVAPSTEAMPGATDLDSHQHVADMMEIGLPAHLAEISDYAGALGSMSGGQGTYTIEMSHYEVVPSNIQARIVEAAKAELEKESD